MNGGTMFLFRLASLYCFQMTYSWKGKVIVKIDLFLNSDSSYNCIPHVSSEHSN